MIFQCFRQTCIRKSVDILPGNGAALSVRCQTQRQRVWTCFAIPAECENTLTVVCAHMVATATNAAESIVAGGSDSATGPLQRRPHAENLDEPNRTWEAC